MTVRIDPDGGIVDGRNDSAKYSLSIVRGAMYTLPNITKTGYVLLGWYRSDVSRGEDGWLEPDPEKDADKFMKPGTKIEADKAMTLTAIWGKRNKAKL